MATSSVLASRPPLYQNVAFSSNCFCLIPNTDLAFVVIAKNACTFLKKVTLFQESQQWPDNNANTHAAIGYQNSSPYLVRVEDMPDYEAEFGRRTKFVVWRDPIARIVSTYKLFCLQQNSRNYFYFLGINRPIDFDRFLEFLRFELTKPLALDQDEHVRRQVDYYHPSMVDHIVSLPHLHEFLRARGVPFVAEQSNQSRVSFELTNPDHEAELREWYAEDFEIPVTD